MSVRPANGSEYQDAKVFVVEMAAAGPVIPITEILKAHRTHHLWDKYKLYNVPISVPTLQEAFKDQLLLTWAILLHADPVALIVCQR